MVLWMAREETQRAPFSGEVTEGVSGRLSLLPGPGCDHRKGDHLLGRRVSRCWHSVARMEQAKEPCGVPWARRRR